jgi:hypothetical protein
MRTIGRKKAKRTLRPEGWKMDTFSELANQISGINSQSL